MNVQKALNALNIVTHTVYTQVINESMKPLLVGVYEHMTDKFEYGQEVWYGDADVYVSVEEGHERFGDMHDVIIIRNVVSCCDEPYVTAVINRNTKFISTVKNVSPRGKKNEFNFGDHRDWDECGLDTLRDHKWEFGYNDLRDDHLVFHLDEIWANHPEINKSYNGWSRYDSHCGYHVHDLLYAQREIEYAHRMIVEYGDYTVCE